MTLALEQAVARLERACRLSQRRFERVPITADVPDALLVDVLAVLASTRTHGEASEVERVSAADAFDMGFEWAMGLRGQTLEDSRAVGRTLASDLFDPIADRIDTSGFNSFESADLGICAAKAIIRAALSDKQELKP